MYGKNALTSGHCNALVYVHKRKLRDRPRPSKGSIEAEIGEGTPNPDLTSSLLYKRSSYRIWKFFKRGNFSTILKHLWHFGLYLLNACLVPVDNIANQSDLLKFYGMHIMENVETKANGSHG